MMRRSTILKLAAIAMAAARPAMAQAAVAYSFVADSAFYENSGLPVTGTFTLTVASPITAANSNFSPADLTSCTISSPWTCDGTSFSVRPAGVSSVEATNAILFGPNLFGFFANEYIFADDAFSTNGTHETLFETGGARQHGFLTVSGIPDDIGDAPIDPNAPVPEPASWALMIGGFALAGAALRRKPAVRYAIA